MCALLFIDCFKPYPTAIKAETKSIVISADLEFYDVLGLKYTIKQDERNETCKHNNNVVILKFKHRYLLEKTL